MTPEQFDAILDDVAAGEPAYKAVVANGAALRTFWRTIATDEIARHKYARAKDLGLERMADEIVAIADDSSGDEEVRVNSAGQEYTVENKEFVGRARLRIDSRKWLLSKLAPKKYGESTTLRGDPEAPLATSVTVTFVGSNPATGSVPVPLADKG